MRAKYTVLLPAAPAKGRRTNAGSTPPPKKQVPGSIRRGATVRPDCLPAWSRLCCLLACSLVCFGP